MNGDSNWFSHSGARFALALALGAALSTGCSAQTEADEAGDGGQEELLVGAIVHGRADGQRDPGVVALLLGDEGLCSGTLIAPRAVLTARHCVSRLVDDAVDCTAPGRQIASDRDPQTLVVLDGNDVRTARPVARGERLIVPPGQRLCDADVAVVVLDRPVRGIAPVPVELSDPPRRGDELVAVGFGRRGTSGDVGVRERRAGVRVLSVSAHEFEVGQATCSGDSGGPALSTGPARDGGGAVVGVVSRGTVDCSSAGARNVYSRVDAWADLVREGIRLGGGGGVGGGAGADAGTRGEPAAADDAADGIGAPCASGNECPSGYCVRASQTCTVTCGPDDPCPAGYRCGLGSGGVHACFRRASP